MGSRYLDSLATVCRSAGLVVHEVDGWERRARGSGGYDNGRPTHLMAHHTASNPGSDPDGDVAYITSGSENAPLANLYLSRSGEVWVIAGGATNTNGSGSAPWPGGCPDDQMNTHAIGIEAANNGVGEPWPQAQQTAYVALCAALCAAYDISPDLVRAHLRVGPRPQDRPGRPVDVRQRLELVADGPVPRRRRRLAATRTTDPDPASTEDDDMAPFLIRNSNNGGIALVYGDGKVTGLDGDSLDDFVARYGPWIDMPPDTYDGFVSKG